MILIADTHAGNEGSVDAFFSMLKSLEASSEPVIFLGDIFDLWIGINRYQTEEHKRFIGWCSEQKQRRTVGFIEGNHEYYVTDERADAFSWVTNTEHREGDLLFSHGDLINTDDVNYIRFRKQIRNSFTRNLGKILPFGPTISQAIKRKTKTTNHQYRAIFPEDALKAYTAVQAARGVKRVFLGHFHQCDAPIEVDGCSTHIIPGWFLDGEIARYTPETDSLDVFNCRDL